MGEKLNILFITSDQQRGDCYGFAGRKVKTPHLDQLAATGTRFSACITPNVVCQPARASILTGLLPRTHGVADNGIDLDEAVGAGGFAGSFARAGWHTAIIGKAHFSTVFTFGPTGRPECRNSIERYSPAWRGPYMGFEHAELLNGAYTLMLPKHSPPFLAYEHWYREGGRGDRLDQLYLTKLPPDVGAAQTFHSGLPVAYHTSTWIGDRTIAFLEANRERPFVAWASFPDPHHPFDAPEPWSRMHHPDDVDLPAHGTLDLERRPWWHRASLEGKPKLSDPTLLHHRTEQSRTPAQSELQMRHLIANYYGMISLIDHNVGRILLALDRLGLADNTLVVYSTDHGDWLGDHGLILKGPMMYEGLLRVGLIARGPGVPAGKIVDDPVSTLDLAATFSDYAGVAASSMRGRALHSRSLRPLIAGEATRDFALNEWELNASRCGVALQLRTVRTRTHKLTLELGSGAGELYDLANDPGEMDNRFGDAGVAPVQRRLTDMIHSRPDDARKPPLAPVGMS
jgi:arylsulfatase A-like enzyme